MKKSKVLKKSGIITGTLLSGALGLTALNASADNLYNYSDMGSGAELRSELIDLNTNATSFAEEAVRFGKHVELKCGEGKCGEGKCGEAKKSDDTKKVEAEVTEKGKKGAKKAAKKAKKAAVEEGEKASKATEAKCGEGKCGEGKCGTKK